MNPDTPLPENEEKPLENNGKHRSPPPILAIITLISTILLLIILRSVLSSFVFACILATLTWPLREHLLKITKGRANLTAGILTFGLIAGIGLPVIGIFAIAFSQAQDLFAGFSPELAQSWLKSRGDQLDNLPLAHQLNLTTDKLLPKLQEGLSDFATWSMNAAVGLGSNIVHTLILLGITLMSLFYLYVSGDAFVARARKLLPLPDSQISELIEVFRRTSKAIFKGNFVIGAAQGLMTGLLFWGAGLSSPAFFGVVAAFASLIPAVGSGLVWGPAVLYFAVSGDLVRALVALGVGVGLISTLDNLLRPTLVGRDAGMHDLMVFLTTIGGLSFFGPLGVLYGPLVGAGALALLRLYEETLP